ncbi:MAG: alpha/beta fold hydrolase [Verrucomicrobiota bacterium]
MKQRRRVVALHGNFGSASDWDFLQGIEAEVIALDLWELVDLQLDEVGQWLCENYGDGETLLAGYSMGGRLALHGITAGASDAWGGAVIVSAHPGLEISQQRQERLESDLQWSERVSADAWEELLQSWNAQPVLNVGNSIEAMARLEPRRAEIAKAFQHWSLGRQRCLTDELKAVGLPLAWLVGERDEKFRALGVAFANQVPVCELNVIPNTGHRILLEQPGAVKTAIEKLI